MNDTNEAENQKMITGLIGLGMIIVGIVSCVAIIAEKVWP